MDSPDRPLTEITIYGTLGHRKARKLQERKLIDEAGNIEEIVIWEVPRSHKHPEGVRYRLAYVVKGRREPSVLYDNHHPKGHHKHVKGQECQYEFLGIDRLLSDFTNDVRSLG